MVEAKAGKYGGRLQGVWMETDVYVWSHIAGGTSCRMRWPTEDITDGCEGLGREANPLASEK